MAPSAVLPLLLLAGRRWSETDRYYGMIARLLLRSFLIVSFGAVGCSRGKATVDDRLAQYGEAVAGRLTPEQARAVQEAVWSLDTCADVADLPRHLVINSHSQEHR